MTLIFLFLTAGYRDSELQFSPFIIHLKWHYCQSLFSLRGGYMGDLLARKQQPARPFGVVRLGRIGGLPCGYGRADEVGLAAARDHARAFERAVPRAKRLHLEAEQFQARLDFFENCIVESDPLIFYDCHADTIHRARPKGLLFVTNRFALRQTGSILSFDNRICLPVHKISACSLLRFLNV